MRKTGDEGSIRYHYSTKAAVLQEAVAIFPRICYNGIEKRKTEVPIWNSMKSFRSFASKRD
jgi:hypothetical protein